MPAAATSPASHFERAPHPIPVWKSALFAAMVVGNVLLAGACGFIFEHNLWSGWELWPLGALLGQLVLAALWNSLGGNWGPLRYGLICIALTCGSAVFLWGMDGGVSEHVVVVYCDLLFAAALIVFTLNCLLSPLRWLLGWRLDFALAADETRSAGRFQLGLRQLFVMPLVCTAPLLAYRWMPSENAPDMAWAMLILGLITALPTLPVAVCIFGERLSWRIRGGLLAVAGLVLAVEALPLFRQLFGEPLWPLGVTASAMVAANVAVARVIGIRWLCIPREFATAATPAKELCPESLEAPASACPLSA